MRIVLDTNVFISGIFWSGNYCSQIIDLWKNKNFELISSIEIIEELTNTLKDFKIRLDYELIESWKILIVENSILVNPLKKFDIVKDDLDDNKFFEAAVEGKADFIISQDKHLLKVGEFQRIKVLKPVDFLKLFSGKNKK